MICWWTIDWNFKNKNGHISSPLVRRIWVYRLHRSCTSTGLLLVSCWVFRAHPSFPFVLAQCYLKQGGPSMTKMMSSMGNLSIILRWSHYMEHIAVLWIGFDGNDSLDPTCLIISLWSHAHCCSQFLSLVYWLLNILTKIINFSAFTQNGQQPTTFQDIQRVNLNCIKFQVELNLSLP